MRFSTPEWRDTVTSTNTALRDWVLSEPGVPSGIVLAAREQTAGRGRHARTWTAMPGLDLTFSFYLATVVPAQWMPSLLMATALGVARALQRHGVEARLKWPNDVVVHDAKICGILAEYLPDSGEGTHKAIVGAGVNVNATRQHLEGLGRPATSILIETGVNITPAVFLEDVLEQTGECLSRWEAGGFLALREDWVALSHSLNHKVRIAQGRRHYTGKVKGYGEDGELILVDHRGWEHGVSLGEEVDAAGELAP